MKYPVFSGFQTLYERTGIGFLPILITGLNLVIYGTSYQKL